MLCAKFQNEWTTVTDVMDERVFGRFEFKMRFGRVSSAAHPREENGEVNKSHWSTKTLNTTKLQQSKTKHYCVIHHKDAMAWNTGSLCRVTSGFPAQRASDIEHWCFFTVSLNRLFSKQSSYDDLRHHNVVSGNTHPSVHLYRKMA